ncbi:MAG TPA: SDR family NAD(P)-dependent oxidoreductase, partial [Devosia sp.]
MNDRTGQVAVVTGASLGVGLAATAALAQRGLNVIAAARDLQRLETAVASLVPEIRHRVKGVACDVREEPQVKAAVDAAIEYFGRLDIVVNSAG